MSKPRANVHECTKTPHHDSFYGDSRRTRTTPPVPEIISLSPLLSDGHLGCSSRALLYVKQLFLQNGQNKSECKVIHLWRQFTLFSVLGTMFRWPCKKTKWIVYDSTGNEQPVLVCNGVRCAEPRLWQMCLSKTPKESHCCSSQLLRQLL